MIETLYRQHSYLLDSQNVSSSDKDDFQILTAAVRNNASDSLVSQSLLLLSHMMSDHFNKQVILLIDEYDVPLAKAHDNHYYLGMENVRIWRHCARRR